MTSRRVLAAALAACVTACSGAGPTPPATSGAPGSPRGGAPPAASKSATAAEAPAAAPIVLSVIGTSDVHGHVESLPVLGGYLSALRGARGADAVVLVDAGDMFQGTLESNMGEGAVMVRGYDVLGYDAAAFGNHEFDFGPVGPHATVQDPGEDPQGALKQRARDAHFPMLAANVDDATSARPIEWPNVKTSTTVKKRGGVVVGVVGVTSEDTPHTTIAANFAGLKMEPIVTAVTREAEALRRAGANVVLLSSHAGGNCKDLKDPTDVASCDPKGEIMAVLEKLPRGTVDAVIAGHTHAAMAHVVGGVPVIQSWATGKAFGRVDLTIDPLTKKVVSSRLFPPTELRLPATYEGAAVAADAKVAAAIAPDVERARVRKEERLGVRVEGTITRSHGKESALGNLFADLMRASHAGADVVAMTNGGGLRADIPAGDLTYGQLFEAIPFDNRFAVLKTNGRELRDVLRRNLEATGGILSLSGVRVASACKNGALDVVIERDPVPPGKKKIVADADPVTIVTSDFLATGGDSTGLGSDPAKPPTMEPTVIRDALEKTLRARGGSLRPQELFDAAKRRFVYPGDDRPVRCGS